MSKFAYDKVLLKLYRTYGKDEALEYLFKEISKLKVEIGVLKSENAELKYDLDTRKDQKEKVEKLQQDLFIEQKQKAKYKKLFLNQKNKHDHLF